MAGEAIDIGGVIIPSSAPAFLAAVGLHVAAALVCVVAGAAAMLSRKGRGRHSGLGSVYYWGLAVVCASALGLAATRWGEDYPLAALAAAAFAAATLGRRAARAGQLGGHLVGMGASYVLMLTAFYVDNGRFLPLWRSLHPAVFWLAPVAVGAPLMLRAWVRHPLLRIRR